MKIAITGEQGFIGMHLTDYFRRILKFEVIELGRNYLEKLANVENLDWLIHGACIQRHLNPEMVLTLNRALNKATLKCLKTNNISCNVIHLSSVQEESYSFYAISKIETNQLFQEFCSQNNKTFISLKLPNVFGKYAVPNKTSFIATFCYNLHNQLPVNYNSNKVNLIYIDEVLPLISDLKQITIPYLETNVQDVYLKLHQFYLIDINKEFPELKNKFELNLYQTFLSYSKYKL